MANRAGSPLSPERLAIARQCVEEGWPIIEIYRTHGIGPGTIRRHFPEYHGLPLKEASALGAAARRANRKARENGQ